ncbi:hypothetical protein SGQ83_01285 [Flavobacterium sp. Fl-318]|uniref:Four helix bundle protein n=1 Tax=Flavobacterium cupriresistens TaxID=2893885 RepID=A0ABU4R7F8_9FLAO|nr:MULTISPECIES: hypothetical protein [unclassified Flavobacterium]MDX6187968.1 hypothetical protein [Flavobacterium sp. Fl-318]UFH42112.1 hypothetical protein LNP23_20165 [Flavobacterium sp. F-323]
MKITLSLSNEGIMIITSALQPVYKSTPLTRREKSTLSIALDVLNKLESKLGSVKMKANLFDFKKKVKFTLKHHEADMLELLLLDQIKYANEIYIKQQLQKTINDLNQKLV